MKGLGKRATTLAFLALVAVALSGAAYSVFSEELGAQAEVSTGSLDGSVACANSTDNETAGWPADSPYSHYPAMTDDDIAEGGALTADDHRMQVTLEDAYPGYAFTCEVRVTNTGTVAWHLEDLSYQVSRCDAEGEDCATISGWSTICDGALCSWGNPGAEADHEPWSPIYITVKDQEGCQVHADDPSLAAWLVVGVNETAAQNAVYKVALAYTLEQWNTSAFEGCVQPRTQ